MALVEPEVIKSSSIFLQGLQEGIEKGIEKGEVRGLRNAIVLTLGARGISLTATRRAQLDAEARAEVLQRWLTRAVTAARVADIFRAR